MAMLAVVVPASSDFSEGPQAAKPWARLPQDRVPRRGFFAAAAWTRARYASRPARLRSRMRSVTASTVGFSFMAENSSRQKSRIVVPGAAVALDQRDGLGWSGCAGNIGLGPFRPRFPGVENALGPDPCGFDLVTAHEQGGIAAHDVHQQALIGVGEAVLEGFREAEVKRNLAQPHAAGSGFLGDQVQTDRLVRLQPDDQPVGRGFTRLGGKNGMRDRAELDDDLRNLFLHPLAGSQVERHPGPAPVADLGLEGDEGFGIAVA